MDNSKCKGIKRVSVSYLDEANNESPYYFEAHYEYLESNMTVNNLEKRNERNVSRHSLKSNKPQRESRSCIT